MRKLSILSGPQDKLDEPPAVAKRTSKNGETPTRYVGDFRNKVIEDLYTIPCVGTGII